VKSCVLKVNVLANVSNNEYLKEAELVRLVKKYPPKLGFPGNDFVSSFYLIARNIVKSVKLRGYDEDFKEDLVQEAVYACILYYRNVKLGGGSLFSYFSQICITAFLRILKDKYKNINIYRDLREKAESDFYRKGAGYEVRVSHVNNPVSQGLELSETKSFSEKLMNNKRLGDLIRIKNDIGEDDDN